jgi:folate-binding protein YgfZ
MGGNSLTPEEALSRQRRRARSRSANLSRSHFTEAPTVNQSALLPQHLEAQARMRAGADAPEVLTFGDVPAEYRAAQEEACLFDETDRGRIDATGPEAAAFLQRITANEVRGIQPGHGSRNLLLSSKGKVLFDFDLARDSDRIWLSVPPGSAKALLTALDTYLFAEKVVLKDTSAEHAPMALCGPLAEEIVRRVSGAEPPRGDHDWIRAASGFASFTVQRLAVAGSPGFRLDAGSAGAVALWRALQAAGARPAGIVVRDILRVEAGAALFGVDIDDGVYPQEARLETGFSLEKGCYIGQEVVAKIDTYGGLNKRLVGLRVSHDDPVAKGTRLYRQEAGEWRDLGVVTSWAYSFVLDSGLVLAYVKRRHQAPGTEFRVGDGEARATIVRLPVRAGAVPLTGAFE